MFENGYSDGCSNGFQSCSPQGSLQTKAPAIVPQIQQLVVENVSIFSLSWKTKSLSFIHSCSWPLASHCFFKILVAVADRQSGLAKSYLVSWYRTTKLHGSAFRRKNPFESFGMFLLLPCAIAWCAVASQLSARPILYLPAWSLSCHSCEIEQTPKCWQHRGFVRYFVPGRPAGSLPAGRPAASMWPGRPASTVFAGRPAKLAGWLVDCFGL